MSQDLTRKGRRRRALVVALAAVGWLCSPGAGSAAPDNQAPPTAEPERGVEAGSGTTSAPAPVAAAAAVPRFADDDLLGDWGGLRRALWDQGVEIKLLLISDPYGNPVGGRDRGFTGYNMFSADLMLDTGRALGVSGGEFHVGFAANFGTQLSQDVVGNTFPIQLADVAPPGPRLTTLSYTQALFHDSLSLRIGRLSIDSLYGEEFAASAYFRQFTSVAFNAIPFAIFYNSPGALGYPATTWGARARYQPAGAFYVMAGVYNADPEVGLASRHGLDFTLNGPAFAIGEIGWQRHQAPDAKALPGNLKLGGFALGGDVQAFDTNTFRGGRHGFYVVADQVIARLGRTQDERQVGIFGSLVTAPATSVNPMPLFFSTGMVAYGPIASRPRDVLAVGIAYGGYSAELRRQQQALQLLNPSVLPQVNELTLELSYGLQLLPGLMLQPGAQVLINPGGSPSTPTALALGVNAVVSF